MVSTDSGLSKYLASVLEHMSGMSHDSCLWLLSVHRTDLLLKLQTASEEIPLSTHSRLLCFQLKLYIVWASSAARVAGGGSSAKDGAGHSKCSHKRGAWALDIWPADWQTSCGRRVCFEHFIASSGHDMPTSNMTSWAASHPCLIRNTQCKAPWQTRGGGGSLDFCQTSQVALCWLRFLFTQ